MRRIYHLNRINNSNNISDTVLQEDLFKRIANIDYGYIFLKMFTINIKQKQNNTISSETMIIRFLKCQGAKLDSEEKY